MAIYRGVGGAGDATGDAASEAVLALAAAAEASASATSASSSATAAAASATAADSSADAAATSASNASGSASAAETAETNAASSASDAADSATAAASSASSASSSASAASTSASNASSSASSASTSATNAASSASSASTSATNASSSASSASTSASTATTQATNASNSASAASTSATNAAASETAAASSASAAATSATNAASSASTASTQATNASNSASSASTSATNAASSASSASTSASSASTSATNASNSASSAASSASSAADSAALAATFDPAFYLTKADPSFTGTLTGTGDLRLNNSNADGAQLQLASSGYSDWNLDNYSGRLRAYYGATEYFTINASGNVGIGTSSLNGTNSSRSLCINGATDAAYEIKSNGTLCGVFYHDGTILTAKNVVSGAFAFGTTNTERMRITSAGGVSFGATGTAYGTAGQFLQSNGNAPPSWASVTASAAGSTTQVQYNNAGAFAGSANLTFNGTNLTCGGTVTASSDETIKTNWRDLPVDFVEQLAKVKHGTFDRTDLELTQDGVSAQSLQPLLPNSVLKGEDGKLSVAYGNAALVSAIALAERVIKQDERIAQLEAIVEKLTGTVTANGT